MFGTTNTQVEIADVHEIGFSSDQIGHQFISRPLIVDAGPLVVDPSGGVGIVIEGAGFMNTSTLSCKFGPFWSSEVIFYNSTHISCISPNLPVPAGDSLPLAISYNGVELATFTEIYDGTIELVAAGIPRILGIDPALVFYGETDIEVLLQAEGLLETVALSCGVGSLVIPGEYI